MKKIFTFLFILFLMISLSGHSQTPKKVQNKPGIWDQPDTRVDNMGYWKKMAAKGLTTLNPDVAIPPAIFKGSALRVRGVRTTNSPDVPVTTLTNVTESENSVFVDPNNASYLLNSNNSTTWTGSSVGSLYGANYFQSANAGIGWVGTPSGAGGPNSGDPTTAISLSGREYVNFISNADGQGVAWSDDGNTWTTATVAPSPGDLADKNHMWIDNKLTSPYEGNLYVAWTDFGGTDDTEIKISRSTNDGANWSTPLNISSAINAGSHNQGVNLQTGPNGEVYAVWAIYDSWPSDESALGFAKSTNGGVSYAAATRILSNIRGIRNTTVSKNHRVNSFPVMAVDISGGPYNGYIYVVWTNIGTPGVNTGTNASVYMIRSIDGGTSWSTPVRVNQGPLTDGKKAYFPWISCDPETGVLSVVFYDDRNVSSTQNEVFAAFSVDAGNTWADFQVSDVAFTPSSIPGLASGYMGDYLGITSKGGKVYPCWTDNRGGVYMTYVSPFELGLNAGFSASTTLLCKGGSVTFSDASTGPPTTWTWSFPGGTPSAWVGQTPPPVVYNTAGVYDVVLTVSDGTDIDTETKTGFITVKEVIADFSATPVNVIVGNNVTFTDNSSCNPTSWQWSFPGGSPSSYSGQTPPAINYPTIGTYNVSLTVTNASGSDTKTRTNYISVAPPVFNMTNGTITTCTGDFYDSGGSSANYADNEVYVMTFYPSTPGATLRFNFSSFNTESGYDTLTIYDGTSMAAPRIGRYHGTTGPGIVTATNGLGALTFRFRSDISLNYSGWAATITCVAGFVGNPTTFSATAASESSINLNWTKNPANNEVMIVWAPANTFGTPVDGTAYTAGNTIPGGGTVLYRGPLTNFAHTALNSSTTYYYRAYSYNASNTYSSGFAASATTFCGTFTLPLTENFATSVLPNCWTKQVSGTGTTDKWTVSNTFNAGGGAYEMKSTYQNINPAINRLVTPPINTMGQPSLNLSFKHYIDGYGTGCTFRIQSSSDGVNWTNEAWSLASSVSNVGPATVNTTIVNNLNSMTTMVAFIIEGNLYQYDYWYVDNVSITSGCTSTNPVSLTISASANPVDQGIPVTFTATPVNGGTTPSFQWKVNGTAAGTNSDTFTYTPVNNDSVTCILNSSVTCPSGNPATSNTIVMTVNEMPVNLVITSDTVDWTECYNALQTISVAGNGHSFLVQNGGDVTMIAGQQINYYPGTTVVTGGRLHGYIAPNGPWCPLPVKSLTLSSEPATPELPSKPFFRVFPNPTSGDFTVALKGYIPGETMRLAVFNMKGEIILQKEISNVLKTELSLSGKPSGLYLVRVESPTYQGSVRLIKTE